VKIATQSFSAEYGGERIAIHRGVTRLDDDHELVARFPSRFTRVENIGGEWVERFGTVRVRAVAPGLRPSRRF
jgi:hypothetical protein